MMSAKNELRPAKKPGGKLDKLTRQSRKIFKRHRRFSDGTTLQDYDAAAIVVRRVISGKSPDELRKLANKVVGQSQFGIDRNLEVSNLDDLHRETIKAVVEQDFHERARGRLKREIDDRYGE